MATQVEPELARLLAENADLRAGLEARTHENALLLEMITDVISTLKLEQVLRHIVEHLVTAFDCHAAFVYLWEPERERLVLRGASDQFQRFIGQIELARGEGLVGWSALTRKPAMLRERAMEDPRFRYFPELEEENFQAMLTVPMTGADGTVVAVISMHTVAPQEFSEEHVRMVGAMAPILGSAIEASGLYESTTRKLSVLATLSGLVQTVRSGRYLDDALRTLAETAVRNTASDLCVLILVEPGMDRLSMRAYGTAGQTSIGALERQPWDRLAAAASPADLGLTEMLSSGQSLPYTSARVAAPLVAAGEQLGAMICYSVAARQYAEDDVALLNIIANQAAIAIKNSQLADLLAERDMPARVFRDLTQGPEDGEEVMRRRAALLGCDLMRPHAPVVLDLAADPTRHEKRDAARQLMATILRRLLADAFPGSLVHVDTSVLAVVRLPAEADAMTLPERLDTLQPEVERECGVRVVGGIGRACRAVAEYRQGFAQAREAMRVSRAARCVGSILHFDHLGAARYLTRIPADPTADLSDYYQDSVERVARYGAHGKGIPMLETLETYLACGGNIARSAERLYVHRNTLVQRLEKLHDILGFNPHDSDHWLPLRIALELRRLQGG